MPHTVSTIEQIVLQYANLLSPSNFTYELPPVSVEVTKVPYVRDMSELPKLCISIGDGHFESATVEDDLAYYGIFGVSFTFIQKSDQKLKQNWPLISDKHKVRKYILNFIPLLANNSIQNLDDINEMRNSVYDPTKLEQGYDYTALNFEFKTQETR